MAVGAFLFGIYADKKGRKSAFLFTLLMFSIASGLRAFAWGLGSLLILRFFIGMGLGGELPVASTLVSESVEPQVRGRVVVLLENFWAVGWILAALIAYFLNFSTSSRLLARRNDLMCNTGILCPLSTLQLT